MKYISLLLLSILGFARQSKHKIDNRYDYQIQKEKATPDTSLVKEGMRFSAILPKDMTMDSIKYYEKARNLEIVMYIPQTGIMRVDTSLRAELMRQKSIFKEELDEENKEFDVSFDAAMTHTFTILPCLIYRNERLYSFLFEISTYHAGGVHPLDTYYSFNFDKKYSQMFTFSDYFTVQSEVDSSRFAEMITSAINQEPITVEKIYEMDFNIEKDSISFNFDNYEISGYGLFKGKIAKSQLERFIRAEYR